MTTTGTRAALVVTTLVLALPAATASAAVTATVDGAQDVLTLAGDGAVQNIRLTTTATDLVVAVTAGGPIIENTTECEPGVAAGTIECELGQVDRSIVNGAGGNDTLVNTQDLQQAVLNGDAGQDTLTKGYYDDRLLGGTENDTLNAGAAFINTPDSGGAGNDILNGGERTDYFTAEPGADTYNGGTRPAPNPLPPGYTEENEQPQDGISYSAAVARIEVTLDGVANDGLAGEGDMVGADIERVSGGDNGNLLDLSGSTSVGAEHSACGGAGNDTLIGSAGRDTLGGGGGNDVVDGNAGDDYLVEDGSCFGSLDRRQAGRPVRAPGTPGNDVLRGGPGDDTLEGGLGSDDLSGGPGTDAGLYNRFDTSSGDAVPIDEELSLDDLPNDGRKGAGEGDNLHSDIENLTSGRGNDRLVGSAGPNLLRGTRGADTLDGLAGIDILFGAEGPDTLLAVGGGFDIADCGADADPTAQVDVGDQLSGCETVAATPLPTQPPPVVDRTGPKLTLSLLAASLKTKAFTKSGTISVVVTPDEPAAFLGEALGRGTLAAVGDVILGDGRLPLAAGKRTLKVKFSKRFRAKVARKLRTKAQRRKGYKVRIRVTATDAAKNAATVTRTVTIKG